MRKRRAQIIVIRITILISVVSLVTYLIALFKGVGNPRWNQVLITYSLIFWVFLAFDQIGREIVAHSNSKQPAARPRPQSKSPLPLPEGGGIRPGGFEAREELGAESSVKLQRITMAEVATLQPWVNDCVTEVMALEGEIPQRDAEGNLIGYDAAKWVKDPTTFAFLVRRSEQTVGALVAEQIVDTGVQQAETGWRLVLLYVRQDVRRQGIGSLAAERFHELLGMLGVQSAVAMEVGENNMRAVRFLQSSGFQVLQHDR